MANPQQPQPEQDRERRQTAPEREQDQQGGAPGQTPGQDQPTRREDQRQ